MLPIRLCPHLSAAFAVNVDGRRRHHGRVFHLPGVRAVLKNPVTVPDGHRETDNITVNAVWLLIET